MYSPLICGIFIVISISVCFSSSRIKFRMMAVKSGDSGFEVEEEDWLLGLGVWVAMRV